MTAAPQPHHDAPACPKGHACGTPWRELEKYRPDVAAWERERNAPNLWCPCCGACWRGSEDEVLQAEMSLVAWTKLKRGGEA